MRFRSFLHLLLICPPLPLTLSAQTFSSAPNAHIFDLQANDYTLWVGGLSPGTINQTTFGLETVCIDLTHTWDSDLKAELIAPDGTTTLLFSGIGGADDNFTNTCLNENAATPIGAGVAPFTGLYRPQGQLGPVNNGQNANGTWTLRITDLVGGDDGTLLGWSVTFGSTPAANGGFTDSNLPIVIINTNGQQILDEPKIMADLGIIWNGPGVRNQMTDPRNDYNGKVGIEMRGSSSQMWPKKPYSLELWDVNGASIDASIVGMPPESDWCLVPGYSDKSLMRNALTYRLGERVGRYAPRGQFAEVVLNGNYEGVYYLCERIKRDTNRVNISKLRTTDLSGDQLTGGYVLKVDKATGSSAWGWTSLYPAPGTSGSNPVDMFVHSPSDGDLQQVQFDYIHSYVDSFERALHGPDFADTLLGYRRFADAESFVDYFLMMEFVKNLDSYRSSCFFYKDRDSKGGKLVMGPLWDFDLSMGNGNFCNFYNPQGWAYQFNYVCPNDGWLVPFWWERLLQDGAFAQRVRCRWEELRATEFDLANLFQWIDSTRAYLDEGQARNFTTWPIMGTYVWPNYYVAADYQGEVDTLKWYLTQRVAWLDANLPGNPTDCLVGVSPAAGLPGFSLLPNPSSGRVRVKAGIGGQDGMRLALYNGIGQPVLQAAVQDAQELDLGTLAAGIYFYRFEWQGLAGPMQRLVLQ